MTGGRSGAATGVLTFLFTDIERSTDRWAADPEAMADALARHDTCLTSCIERQGGQAFKHTGDGVCAVFGSPHDAVSAALDAQRALAAADFTATGGLPVRMGIHTGVAERRGGDYFGPDLNKAARVMDAGQGGQVVVSSSTAALVGDRVVLQDRGEYLLRGIDRPERLWEVPTDRGACGRPLRAVAVGTAASLPVFRTSFVGRDGELADLAHRIAPGRVVTVVGPGGVGKTRLCVELASRVELRFADGVRFVDLSAVLDESGFAELFAAALGMQRGGPGGAAGDTAGAIADHLHGRDVLLVVDNCEHLVDACADLVDVILERCPSVAVLATSREALSIDGEVVWRVPSLDAAGDGAALFASRAELACPEAASRLDLDLVAQLCERLDGIPLAIELAAAQIGHLGLEDLADRLDDRLRLLAGGRRRVERQRTLEATLDWSHGLLEGRLQALLRRLGVFAGDFSLEDAEQVAGASVGNLRDLVAKSLVMARTDRAGARFRLLETVRIYALERLAEAGETDRLRHAHLAWYRTRVPRELIDFVAVTPELLADADNVRAALDWAITCEDEQAGADLAVGLAGVWFCLGLPDEARSWLARLRHVTEDPVLRARVMGVEVVSDRFHDIATLAHDPTLADARALLLDAGRADTPVGREIDALAAYVEAIRADGARECLDRARATVRDDPRWTAFLDFSEGIRAMLEGDLETSAECFRHGLAVGTEHESLYLFSCSHLVNALWCLGRFEELPRLAETLDGSVASTWMAYVPEIVQAVALCPTDERRAREHALLAAELVAVVGRIPGAMEDTLVVLATVEHLGGRHARAAELYGAAGSVRRAPGTAVLGVHLEARLEAALGRRTLAHHLAVGAAELPQEVLAREVAAARAPSPEAATAGPR